MAKRTSRKDPRDVEGESAKGKDPKLKIRFHVALLVLLASFTILTVVSLILVLILGFILSSFTLGIILLMILVPLISGFIAGRHVIRRDTWLLGIMGGIIWSALEIAVIFIGLFNVQTVMRIKPFGTLEVLIMLALILANCMFCLLGLRISAKPNSLLQVKPTTGD